MENQNPEELTLSRRKTLAGLGTTLALVAASPVASFAQAPMRANAGIPDMSDPRTKYPKPPFPEQKQPWPGLASKMTPRAPTMAKPATKVPED